MTTPAESRKMRKDLERMLERRRGEPEPTGANPFRHSGNEIRARVEELEREAGLKRTVRRADIRCKVCGIVGRATIVTVEVVGTVSVWVGLPSRWWLAMPVEPEALHCRCPSCLTMHERGPQ